MSETPQAPTTGTGQVPPQSHGQEERTPPTQGQPQPPMHRQEPPPEPTGWAGWIVFASLMLILAGTFQAVTGFAALFNSGYYLVVSDSLLITVDYSVWGWVHIVVGAVAVGTAFGLLAGQTWARVLGVVIAALSALVNLAFLAAFPLWSATVITFDIIVIYAITVHGAELRKA